MTYSVGRHIFFCARAVVFAGVLALPFAASGCTSTAPASPTPVGAHGAQDTGTYPNLNIPPQSAAPQLTDEQKAAKLASLHAAQGRQGAKASAVADNSAAMTTLARKHGDDTLKAIERECQTIDPACK